MVEACENKRHIRVVDKSMEESQVFASAITSLIEIGLEAGKEETKRLQATNAMCLSGTGTWQREFFFYRAMINAILAQQRSLEGSLSFLQILVIGSFLHHGQ